MSGCGSGYGNGAGPFSTGLALVKFVCNAHGGGLINAPISGGALETDCQGCGSRFLLKTFVGKCPECGGVHAVSPPRSDNPSNIQYAGEGFSIPGG